MHYGTYLERLKRKYDVVDSGCWVWKAALSPSQSGKHPYGIMLYHGRMQMAHRVSYMEHKGKIPKGLQLDHLCRNTLCVNPSHLEPVTHRENLRRGVDARQKPTHCKYGHEMIGHNIYYKKAWNGRVHHYCRTCKAAHEKKVYNKKRGIV